MFNHYSVLLHESVDGLNIKPDGIYVDATLGGAGHSSLILSKLNSKGLLIGIDQDKDAIKVADERLSKISSNYKIIHTNFANMKDELAKIGIDKVDGVIFDLGVSSYQFDTKERGFSYRFDGPLDMRMNQENTLSAFDVVNKYSFEQLTKIFFEYGEEKFARKIADNIIKDRKVKPIETTFELVDIIKKSLPAKVLNSKGHPAKQVFQAIRIEVNDELNVLKKALNDSLTLLNSNGKIAVITFQSLEDKIVKYLFKEKTTINDNIKGLVNLNAKVEFKLVTSKAIVASDKELEENNRSHSAKLRIIEKI